ncbi:guanine nucleotide binding protein, alpha subunit [Mycena albidolilacea]|uniref:Guanine nucleotide binding protein, alpha subunit n=1 Tax=Mycena albidolilacea TaxID=1033008 RepID=A0AAD6ZPV7_9AGAR|nr:guanine nucleotide binding protein, alpha subunit [Mycena albidolilacea]
MPGAWKRLSSVSVADTAKSRSEEIDAAIAQDLILKRSVKRVLILGGRNSGKSTFLKQATVFSPGFSEAERDEYKCTIHADIIATMRMILDDEALLSDNDLRRFIQSFRRATEESQTFSPQISTALRVLWTDARAQTAIRFSPKLRPDGSLLYFMDSLSRISEDDYIPTDADIVRSSRPPSLTVTDTPLQIQLTFPQYEYLLKTTLTCIHQEIGLQRKWFSLFSDVEAIVFLVDLSNYDQTIPSADTDEPRNYIREAMSQFVAACTASYYRPTVMLIMNKMDIFTAKLSVSPLTTCFPEYRDENTPSAAADYVIARFLSLLPPHLNSRAWCTNAIDMDQMHGVLQAMGEFILRHSWYARGCV